MSGIPWTVPTLKTALDAHAVTTGGEFSASVIAGHDPVLVVTVHNHGDLQLYVNVSEAQIAASVLLWPCDEQDNRPAFNEFLLKTQKMVPLSNFGIGTVEGRDYYELFGELATTSALDEIVFELRTLAENAIEAATHLRDSFVPAA